MNEYTSSPSDGDVWSFARLTAPTVTITTSIILSFNKSSNGDILIPATYPGLTWKSAVKQLLFLPRDAMRKRGLCPRPVSVRPSVRHVGGLYPHG